MSTNVGAEQSRYEALSYVWGDAVANTYILLNGVRVFVQRSLMVALRNLRRKNRPRRLWIDALCIDQGNYTESGDQVACMPLIYQAAESTVMYLGEKSASTAMAINFIQQLCRLIESNPHSLLPMLQDPQYALQWAALQDILERSYWNRVWIVQEVAVSKRVIMIIGRHQLSFQSFKVVINALADCYMHKIHQFVHMPLPALRINPVWAVLQARDHFQSRARLDLAELLVLFLSSFSSDPRDKVFALYSLCANEQRKNGKDAAKATIAEGKFPPTLDYSHTTEELFMLIIRYLATHAENLDILSALNPIAAHRTLPSWCPDWRSPSPARLPSKTCWWNCAGNTKPELSFDLDRRVMTAKGFAVDSIRFIISTDSIGFDGDWDTEIAKEVNRAGTSPYGNESSWRVALLDTILLDAPAWVMEKSYKAMEGSCARLEGCCNCSCCRGECYVAGTGLAGRDQKRQGYGHRRDGQYDIFSTWYPRRLLEDGLRPWLYPWWMQVKKGVTTPSVRNIAANRMFFFSVRGYMGLVPEGARPGDNIIVLYGGRTPFCVRRVGGETGSSEKWRFVGDSYCHGIMAGEAMTEPRSKSGEERLFQFV